MLFAYIFAGFMLYCGIYNLTTFGYSDGSLIFIIIGAFIFLLKPFVCFRDFVKSISDSRNARASKSTAPASNPPLFSKESNLLETRYEDLYNAHIALRRKYSKLEESHMKLMSARAFDPEADAEIQRLTHENNQLRSDLEASQAAVAFLNRQLKELNR